MKIFFAYLCALLQIVPIISSPCCCDTIQSTFGFVEGGNSTLFTIWYPESFDLCLSSETGDADLYVSNENSNPTYEPGTYILHSATCGEDFVHIHKNLKRPVHVSVFGYPSSDVSIYLLRVVARESAEEDYLDFQLLDLKNEQPLDEDNLTADVTFDYFVTGESDPAAVSKNGETDLLLRTTDVDRAAVDLNQTATEFMSSDHKDKWSSFLRGCVRFLQLFLEWM